MHIMIIAKRVLSQLRGDKRFLGLSIAGPIVIIFLLKVLFDSLEKDVPTIPTIPGMPAAMSNAPLVSTQEFILPASAFVIHFLCFVICAILLVQERTRGTLERMLISGVRKTSIIGGYTLGYFGLATLQSIIVVGEVIWLFSPDLDTTSVVLLFCVIWLLAIVSVMLGIFISTFARHEGHVFPFIPLLILPSVLLTGVIVDPDKMPRWAELIGQLFPLRYANNIIGIISKPGYGLMDVLPDFGILLGYAVVLWLLASRTMKETE
jgi:ABC-2 type transport system permease protein